MAHQTHTQEHALIGLARGGRGGCVEAISELEAAARLKLSAIHASPGSQVPEVRYIIIILRKALCSAEHTNQVEALFSKTSPLRLPSQLFLAHPSQSLELSSSSSSSLVVTVAQMMMISLDRRRRRWNLVAKLAPLPPLSRAPRSRSLSHKVNFPTGGGGGGRRQEGANLLVDLK